MSTSCAVIHGATGAVGSELLQLCLNDANYQSVVVLARKPSLVEHSKLTWLTSVDELATALDAYDQVDVYCCLGTTLKQAGSKEAFRKVDYDLVVEFAKHCRALGIDHFCAVSALGANAESRNYYSRTKSEMETALIELEFKSLSIFRPSLLDTKRNEFRNAERIATLLLNTLSPLLFGKLRNLKPITPAKVAHAMHTSCRSADKGVCVIGNLEIHKIASK